MATLLEQCSNVRRSLGDALPMNPSLSQTWQAVIRQGQSFYNQLNNTSAAWATGEIQLTVQANVSDYQINAPNWGKCMLVSTVDAGNPGHWERWVPFYEPQNLLLAYDGPRDGANWFQGWIDGSQHTALGIAFLRQGNAIIARIRPVPQASATYNILYSIGNWAANAALGSIPVLPEHHQLIEIKAALSLLPLTEWWSVDPMADNAEQVFEATRRRREQFERALIRDAAQFQFDFDNYKRSQVSAKVTFKRPSLY